MKEGMRKIDGKTPFEQKWGISAKEFAAQEGVTTEAIHMRVRNYGTIYQRRAKPTIIEGKYGATIYELGKKLNLHPMSVVMREYHHGDVYRESENKPSPIRGKSLKPEHLKKWRRYHKVTFWLHELHPDYKTARKGFDNA